MNVAYLTDEVVPDIYNAKQTVNVYAEWHDALIAQGFKCIYEVPIGEGKTRCHQYIYHRINLAGEAKPAATASRAFRRALDMIGRAVCAAGCASPLTAADRLAMERSEVV